jgi:HlyD family secretion protein
MRRICQVGLGLWVFVVGCTSHQPVVKHTGLLEGISVHVPVLTGGKIVQMKAEEGIEVTAGDTLAQIDDTEWVLQLQELQASIDELAVQEQLAKTAVRRAQVDVDYFQEKYDRIKTLQEREATAQQNVDDLKNRVQQSQLSLLTAQQQVQGLLAKQRQLRARYEIILKKIRDATVIAPEDGMVQTRYFERGEAVPALQAVVELIQVRNLDVKVYIPENMLPQMKVGQMVQIHADGLNQVLNGHVKWVSDLAEFTPKTVLTPETRASLVYAVTIGIPNPDRILKHGMPVEVVF